MNKIGKKANKYIKYAGTVILAILLCYIIYRWRSMISEKPIFFLKRMMIVTPIFVFTELHFVFDIKKIYSFIFKYRVLICCILVLYSVINNFNGSSLGIWNGIIQPEENIELGNPIFGSSLSIRSDEWDVNIPRMMSASYNGYGKYNEIVRGVKTENISASGLYKDYSALYNPSRYGYYLMDFSHGLSFQWSYMLIFGFLFSFELCYILSRNKYMATLGGSLLWFSPFNGWWSLSLPLLSLAAIPTLFYYTLTSDKWKKRFLFAIMLAIAGADFCCNLYPAWQVPIGWIILSIMIYMLCKYQNWRKYRWFDWAIIIIAITFMTSIIFRYIIADASYIDAVSKTVYPGKRVEYGGYSLPKLLGYLGGYLAGIFDLSLIPNNSEAGTFIGAFPLGFILIPISIFLYFRKRSKGELTKEDKYVGELLIPLVVPMAFLTIYCTIGLPHFIAKIMMLTSSTAIRTVDFLGALLVISVVVNVTYIRDNGGLNWIVSGIISFFSTYPALIYCKTIVQDNSRYAIEISALVVATMIFFMLVKIKSNYWKPIIIIYAIIVSIGGIAVNPIQVGTYAITDKSASKEINKIVSKNKNAKWASTETVLSQYLIANGASTITGVNYIPNIKLWNKLDPSGTYENTYNRYAHVALALSNKEELKLDLMQADLYVVTVGKHAFKKMGIRYLVTQGPVGDNWDDSLKLIYNEGNIFIYENK